MKKLFIILSVFFSISNIYAQNNMDIVWQSCYGGSEDEEQLINIIEVENGYLVLGSTESVDGDVTLNHGMTDLWLISVDSSGNILWEKSYGGSNLVWKVKWYGLNAMEVMVMKIFILVGY